MRILFVTFALAYSGAGKMIAFLANYVAEQGYDTVIYVQEKEGCHYNMHPKIEIIYEKKYYTNYITRHFQQTIQLRNRVAEIRPDVIVSFNTNQNAMAVVAAAGRGIPVIVSERGDPYQYTNIIAKIKTAIINRASGGVFQTHKALEYYGKSLQSRSIVIANPAVIQKYPQVDIDSRLNEIAFVARLDIHQKRQDLALKAFSKIAEKNPDLVLAFYGDGPDELKLKELAIELGISNQVIFYGLQKNIPQKIRKSKMFLLTSDFEGMPNALIEAMAVGLPCVSTDCSPGGAAELINNYENGIIVPKENIEELVNAIDWILNNPEKAQQMGLEAMKIIDRLNPEGIYGQWLSYINAIYDNQGNK